MNTHIDQHHVSCLRIEQSRLSDGTHLMRLRVMRSVKGQAVEMLKITLFADHPAVRDIGIVQLPMEENHAPQ